MDISRLKWKTYLGLILIGLNIAFGWMWVWGIFFGLWTYSAIKTRTTYVAETITLSENPVLYWGITALWAFFAVWSFVPLIKSII
jgi:hypothetical protein